MEHKILYNMSPEIDKVTKDVVGHDNDIRAVHDILTTATYPIWNPGNITKQHLGLNRIKKLRKKYDEIELDIHELKTSNKYQFIPDKRARLTEIKSELNKMDPTGKIRLHLNELNIRHPRKLARSAEQYIFK